MDYLEYIRKIEKRGYTIETGDTPSTFRCPLCWTIIEITGDVKTYAPDAPTYYQKYGFLYCPGCGKKIRSHVPQKEFERRIERLEHFAGEE